MGLEFIEIKNPEVVAFNKTTKMLDFVLDLKVYKFINKKYGEFDNRTICPNDINPEHEYINSFNIKLQKIGRVNFEESDSIFKSNEVLISFACRDKDDDLNEKNAIVHVNDIGWNLISSSMWLENKEPSTGSYNINKFYIPVKVICGDDVYVLREEINDIENIINNAEHNFSICPVCKKRTRTRKLFAMNACTGAIYECCGYNSNIMLDIDGKPLDRNCC